MRQLMLLTWSSSCLPIAGFAQLLYPLQQERYVSVRIPLTPDDPNNRASAPPAPRIRPVADGNLHGVRRGPDRNVDQ